jgi:hypothetical protein
MDPFDQFFQAIGGTLIMLLLAGVARLIRPFHVPYLVNGWNPFGRTFDEASALRQNQFAIRGCLGIAALLIAYGVGALGVGLVQHVT